MLSELGSGTVGGGGGVCVGVSVGGGGVGKGPTERGLEFTTEAREHGGSESPGGASTQMASWGLSLFPRLKPLDFG